MVQMDAMAENRSEEELVIKHQIQSARRTGGLARDGTAKPIPQDQTTKFWGAHGDRGKTFFSLSSTARRIGNPTG